MPVGHTLSTHSASKAGLLIYFCWILSACHDEQTSVDSLSAGSTIDIQNQFRFNDVFTKVMSIRPQQDDATPIIRVSALDFDAAGAFLIADASEGNVKTFHPDGARKAIIGRPGSGPGEFRDAAEAAFGPKGMVHVIDLPNQRISVFTQRGDLVREIPVTSPTGSGITTFDVLSDGSYLVGPLLQNSAQPLEQHLLYVLDQDGGLVRSISAIDALRPPETAPSEYWAYFQHVRFSQYGGDVAVIVPAADTLWITNLEAGTTFRFKLNFPGYEPLRLPNETESFKEWLLSVQRGTTPHFNAAGLVVSFVNGILHEGDPSVRLARIGESWYTITGGPPIIGHTDSLFVAIEGRLGDPLEFGYYTVNLDAE